MHQGKVLELVVKTAGLSASEFAAKLEFTRPYIYEMFKKEFITSEVISKVCTTFKISPLVFFDAQNKGITILTISGVPAENDNSFIIEKSNVISCHHVHGV